MVFLLVKTGVARLSNRASWSHVCGINSFAGIGHTKPLLIGSLSFSDINKDLARGDINNSHFETTPVLSEVNIRRVNFLHDNDVNNLPNFERPKCHQDGHTYPSVYGRILADEPAQTITTGYGTPGRGRHVHPTERRVMTNREAARVQSFPDWYWRCDAPLSFDKNHFQKIIGDAVPAHMVFPLLYSLFK